MSKKCNVHSGQELATLVTVLPKRESRQDIEG